MSMLSTDSASSEYRLHERVCATTCKRDFGLSERELRMLPVQYARNPVHRRSQPVRMFVVSDIEELAAKLEQERIRDLQDAPREAAERSAARTRERDTHRRLASESITVFTHTPGVRRFGSAAVPLDRDCLERIACAIGAGVEMDGVYGPTAVARDLCAFAQTCCVMRTASRAGFRALETGVSQCGTECVDAHQLDACFRSTDMGVLLERPLSLSMTQLRRLARALGVRTCGTKCEIAFRSLKVLRIRHTPSARYSPSALAAVLRERTTTALPPRLLRALRALRANEPCADVREFCARCLVPVDSCASGGYARGLARRNGKIIRSKANHEGALVGIRELVSTRYGSIEQIERACALTHRPSEEAGARACVCGATWAQTCTKGVCATCCRSRPGACPRHRVQPGA